jgi:integrase/recombinase XerD
LHKLRKAGYSTSPNSPFFVAPGGGKYGKSAFTETFLEIVRKLGIHGPTRQRALAFMTFVTRCSEPSSGVAPPRTNLFAKLPLLSTYLGHTTVTHTEVYLHATAELLEGVGKRFHAHFAIPALIEKERHGKN